MGKSEFILVIHAAESEKGRVYIPFLCMAPFRPLTWISARQGEETRRCSLALCSHLSDCTQGHGALADYVAHHPEVMCTVMERQHGESLLQGC